MSEPSTGAGAAPGGTPSGPTPTPTPTPATPPPAALLSIDEFKRVELLTARIVAVEEHPNADRLYVIKVDDGRGGRQVVAGIRTDWKKEDLVGKTVIIAANLKPALLRGVESQGMILAVKGSDRVLPLTTFDGTAAPGTRVT